MAAVFSALLKGTLFGACSVFAINCTEHLRMARNIQLGKVSVVTKNEILEPTYCQIPPDTLIQDLERGPYKLYGIVGLKSTGKTSTLKLVARNVSNVVHVKMTADEDVSNVLYDRLNESIFHFPWYLNSLRLDRDVSSEKKVAKVFSMVEKYTKKPVTTVIEVRPSMLPFQLSEAKSFIRQIKYLVSDDKTMRCLFDSSEGGQFERVDEPRLNLYTTSELPSPIAERYLKEKYGVVVNEEVKNYLCKLPRRFDDLSDFANSTDREAYVDMAFLKLQGDIKESLDPRATEVYRKVLKNGKIDVVEYTSIGFSKAEFETKFLNTNILTDDRSGFRFQFDATAKAARLICKAN